MQAHVQLMGILWAHDLDLFASSIGWIEMWEPDQLQVSPKSGPILPVCVEIGAHAEDLCTEDYEIWISANITITNFAGWFFIGFRVKQAKYWHTFCLKVCMWPNISWTSTKFSHSAIRFCRLLELKPPKANKNLIDTVRCHWIWTTNVCGKQSTGMY